VSTAIRKVKAKILQDFSYYKICGRKKKYRNNMAGVFKMPQNLIQRSVLGVMQAYIRNGAERQLRMKKHLYI
jgi:hypothetical protein